MACTIHGGRSCIFLSFSRVLEPLLMKIVVLTAEYGLSALLLLLYIYICLWMEIIFANDGLDVYLCLSSLTVMRVYMY